MSPNQRSASTPQLSIIIPQLNEHQTLPALIAHLQPFQQQPNIEIILVDGGSCDGSVQWLENHSISFISAAQGRAAQMNAGAAQARGELLLFLHADTRLPLIEPAMLAPLLLSKLHHSRKLWGRFDVKIEGVNSWFPLISFFINWRSRLTGIATGDQAMFIQQTCFERLQGFAQQPLMEDVEISARLRKISLPLCLKEQVVTSGRRWQRYGVWKTIVLMWRLRLGYWLGQTPEQLARHYRSEIR